MTQGARDFGRRLAVATGLSLGLLLVIPVSVALAQQPSITKADSITAVVTVKSVDMASRRLVVTTAAGEDITMKAPPEIQRLGDIKPGDKIRTTYTAEVELVLSQPNQPLPEDAQTVVAARVAKGDLQPDRRDGRRHRDRRGRSQPSDRQPQWRAGPHGSRPERRGAPSDGEAESRRQDHRLHHRKPGDRRRAGLSQFSGKTAAARKNQPSGPSSLRSITCW